jgi:hypothetical protein
MQRSAGLLVAVLAICATPTAAQIPGTFTNLQVLPKDIAQRPLVNTMRGFALALNVRCEFCHVGEGDDLSKFDFASDAKPQKLVARTMIRMLGEVNRQVAGVGEPSADPKVTCFTCHRGARKPATQPEGRGGGVPRKRGPR